MIGMRNLMIGAIALVLLFGCIGQENVPEQNMKAELEKELNQTVSVPETGLISVSGSDGISVVTIRTSDASGRWQFPLSTHEDEFVGAGLYSDSFIRLDSSQVKWLEPGEAIWLTPMVKDGNGVLFNAIYTDEPDCKAASARILGKEYALLQLKNGSSFGNDDKWKIALESEGACVKRVVVYLDGYFSDMKDGEQISLFRNDNTILFGFENLESGPQVKVIATRPVESTVWGNTAKTARYNITIAPGVEGPPNYTGVYAEEPEGIHIWLDRTMPVYNDPVCQQIDCGSWDRTDGQLYDLPIMNSTWRLVRLEYGAQGGYMLLGKDPQEVDLVNMYLDGYGNFGDGILPNETASVMLGSSEWGMKSALASKRNNNTYYAVLYRLDRPSASFELPVGKVVSAGGEYLSYMTPREDYVHGTARGVFYKYSDIRELRSGEHGIMLEWENVSGMISLKSVSIPAAALPLPAVAPPNAIMRENTGEDAPECLMLDSPGTYGLPEAGQPTPCVIMDSSDVVLDCQGRKIEDTIGTYLGVLVKGGRNVTVENCTINGFEYAIDLVGTEAGIIRNNAFQSCYKGIMEYRGVDNLIEGNNDTSCHIPLIQSNYSSIFG